MRRSKKIDIKILDIKDDTKMQNKIFDIESDSSEVSTKIDNNENLINKADKSNEKGEKIKTFFKKIKNGFSKLHEKSKQNKVAHSFVKCLKSFSIWFYKQSYLLGVFVIRNLEKFWDISSESSIKLFNITRSFVKTTIVKPFFGLIIFFEHLVFDFVDPFSDAADITTNAIDNIKVAAKGEKQEFKSSLKSNIFTCLKSYLKCLINITNHVAPVAAAVVLVFVIGRASNLTFALEINYNGKSIGYVEDEMVFAEAQKMMESRIVFENAEIDKQIASYDVPVTTSPREKEVVVKDNVMDTTITAASPASLVNATPVAETNEFKSVSLAAVDKTTENVTNVSSNDDIDKIDTKFTLKIVENQKMDDIDTLCDKLITNLDNVIVDATGLYIDNKFYGAAIDGDKIDSILQDVIAKHDDGSGIVEFNKNVELKEGLYPTEVVREIPTFEKLINSKEQGKKEYTVVKGDAPISIAQKNNIPLADLIALNPNIEKECFIGDKIIISAEKPFLPIRITKQETYHKEIAFQTENSTSDKMYKNEKKVAQKGQNGSEEIVARVSYVDGIEVDREVLKSTVIAEPVTEKIVTGTKNKTNYSSGSDYDVSNLPAYNGGFIWPTSGGRITCGYLGYPGHRAVDIGRPTGTPVYASAPGKVVYVASQSYGYGKHIIIDHGNGYKTLYAHNSELLVKPGQYVKQGQQIAKVGATGRAYGSHLHFEVIYNNRQLNPANFL